MKHTTPDNSPLFSPAPGLARHDAPPTSKAAALDIAPITGKQRSIVLAAIRAATTGLTDEQGIAITGINPSAYRPRRCELAEFGAIRLAGVTRKTASGRAAQVWVSAEGER